MKDRKLAFYDVEWQALRISLLGKWTLEEKIQGNLDKLKRYVGDGTNYTKLWRVLNLLNATRMSYHALGLIDTSFDKELVTFRDSIQDLSSSCVDRRLEPIPGNDEIRSAWLKQSPAIRKAIFDDLSKRLFIHNESKYREELRWFLEVLRNA